MADDEVDRPRGRRRGLAIGAALAVGATVVGPAAAASAAVATPTTPGGLAAPSWPGLSAAGSSSGVLEVSVAGSTGQVRGAALAMTADGIALAPLHLVDGASSILVTDPASGRTSPASVLVSDPRADVAVLRVTGLDGLATVDLEEITEA